MRIVNQREHALAFLRHKLYRLLHGFHKDCNTTYKEAAAEFLKLDELEKHINWLERFNRFAPQLRMNHTTNLIEVHIEGAVLTTTVPQYDKLVRYLQYDSLELPRQKAHYMVEMLNVARNFRKHDFAFDMSGRRVFNTTNAIIDGLLNLDVAIEKFYYLVYYLMPLYHDHIRLQLS